MKSILISDQLHKELKLYAVNHGASILKIVESAIGNLVSAKPVGLTESMKPKNPMVVSSQLQKEIGNPRGNLDANNYV